MGILTRVTQLIFGSNAGANQLGQIGSKSAGAAAYSTNLATIQNLPQFLAGLYGITNQGANPPYIQDINALYYLITSQIAYQFQAGIPEYDPGTNYYNLISFAQVNGVLFQSISGAAGTPNIGNAPATSPTYWRNVDPYAATAGLSILRTPGLISPYAGATAPTGFLVCDGSAISRTTYANLFAKIGTTFGAGDGSTTFNIPDGRAATLRGVGTSTKFTQNVTITLGQIINDILQGHLHLEGRRVTQTMSSSIYAYGVAGGASLGASTESASGTVNYQQGNTSTPLSDGADGIPRTANETSGKALGVNWIIQY